MGTHIHLLIKTPQPNLAAGMQRAHGRYAELFNVRHARVGHVFQGRYGAVRVRTDAQLHAVAQYIDRNPVEAGIDDVADPLAVGERGAGDRDTGRVAGYDASSTCCMMRLSATPAAATHSGGIGVAISPGSGTSIASASFVLGRPSRIGRSCG